MADDEEGSQQTGKPRRRPISRVASMTLLALTFAALSSWVVWLELSERHARGLAAHFTAEGAQISLRIEERFKSYRGMLRSGQALFRLAGDVDRTKWRAFVATLGLTEDFPGIQGFGFSKWIEPEDLPAHVAEMRGLGYEHYRVWPEGARDGYSSIVMLEPADWRNLRAYGFDMYSEPVRREAMTRAVRTGRSALTGRTILVQETETDVQAGVLIYAPLFERDMPLETDAERRRALLGWVYMPFRMADLMQGILGRLSDTVRLRIYDDAEAPGNLLYDSHAGRDMADAPELMNVDRLQLAGREWIVRLDALPGYAPPFSARQAELISIALVGLLFVVVTWSFSVTRERARMLAATSSSLRRSEARYSALVNLAQEGIAATDDDFRLMFVNPSLVDLLGSDPAEVLGRPLDEFWRDGEEESRAHVVARLRDGRGKRYEKELVRGDGRILTVLVSDAPLTDDEGNLKGAIVVIADITERKDVERRMAHLATHDVLTGVPNRLMFDELLSQAVDQARRYRHRLALLFVDLDRFKEANDEFGHDVGDRVLTEAVRRMQGSVRGSDLLGRRGGDEFVVLLPEIDSRVDAEVVAEKIRAALAQPFTIAGHEIGISSSIGIALYPDHGADDETLLRRADEAMYRAKGDGRNRVCCLE